MEMPYYCSDLSCRHRHRHRHRPLPLVSTAILPSDAPPTESSNNRCVQQRQAECFVALESGKVETLNNKNDNVIHHICETFHGFPLQAAACRCKRQRGLAIHHLGFVRCFPRPLDYHSMLRQGRSQPSHRLFDRNEDYSVLVRK